MRSATACRWRVKLCLLSALCALATSAAPSPAVAAGTYPKYLPPCKPVIVINVRGSGQKGPTQLSKPWHGMPQENPGLTVQQDLAALVGPAVWANVSPTDLPYEAIAVNLGSLDWLLFDYDVSRKDGETSLGLLLTALNSKCSQAQIILVGYSQGADAIGEELPRVAASIRRKIAGVALFGDPRFNAGSRAAKGSFNPSRAGIRGARPEFPTDVPVTSYCRSLDPVCQGLAGHRIVWTGIGGHLPVVVAEGFDKDAHTHYQDSEAHGAAQWLRAQLSRRGLLNLPAPTASLTPLDVSFVIDTTGSMTDAISSVRSNVADIRAQLAAQSTSFQAALTEYRDEPDEESDFQARLLTDLTPDVAAFADALERLDAEGGGDRAESVFGGLHQGLAVGWRPAASKAVVVVGDAPPKDPEPVTGHTLDQTVRRANLLGIPIHSMIVDDDEEAAQAFTSLSARTAGTAVPVDDPTQVSQAIVAALQRNAGAPTAATVHARGGVTHQAAPAATVAAGYVGIPVRLSAGASNSPLGDALTYTWEFGDGQVATTNAPVISHTWAAPFAGDIALTVTDSAGRAGRTIQSIGVFAGGPRAIAQPTHVEVAQRPGKLKLRWRRPKSGQPVAYRVVNGGRVLGIKVPTKEQRFYSLELAKPPRCETLRLRVVAADAVGRTAASKTTKPLVVKPRRMRFGRSGGKRVQRAVDGACKSG